MGRLYEKIEYFRAVGRMVLVWTFPLCHDVALSCSKSQKITENQCVALKNNELLNMAERQGFEPWVGYKPTLVFKTSAFNRSATSPERFEGAKYTGILT